MTPTTYTATQHSTDNGTTWNDCGDYGPEYGTTAALDAAAAWNAYVRNWHAVAGRTGDLYRVVRCDWATDTVADVVVIDPNYHR